MGLIESTEISIRQLGITLSLIATGVVGGYNLPHKDGQVAINHEARVQQAKSITIDLHTKTGVADSPTRYSLRELKGRAFAVGPYVLTVDHVVSNYEDTTITPFGRITIALNKLEEHTYLDGIKLQEVVKIKDSDVAIFDLRPTPELCSRYCNDLTLDDLALKKDLKLGAPVYWIGNPQNMLKVYIQASIGSMSVENVSHNFATDQPITPGTSGSPVWTENGSRKIAGVAQHLFIAHGGVVFMDHFLPYLKDLPPNKTLMAKAGYISAAASPQKK